MIRKMTHFRKITIFSFLMILAGIIVVTFPAYAKSAKAKVMTRNLYLGADIFKVVDAAFIIDPGPPPVMIPNPDPYAIPTAVAEVFATMQYTNFPARAEALADEIKRKKPHVIGLQEVSTYYKQTPGDFLAGNPEQATEVYIDFFTVLNDALLARGLKYNAFVMANADIEMPMLDAGSPTGLSDVRLVDHDVILVRHNLKTSDFFSDHYEAQVGFVLGADYVEFTRGYLGIDVKIGREVFRFVNTHLEVRSDPGSAFRVIQSWQMGELTGVLDFMDDSTPIIMVGDFNSSIEDVPGTGDVPGIGTDLPYMPPYWQALGAGYLDAWLEQRNPGDGFTSGFDETIDNPEDSVESRIDLIFLGLPPGYDVRKVSAAVVGVDPGDMVPNIPMFPSELLWPSDHAGVAANIKFRITPAEFE